MPRGEGGKRDIVLGHILCAEMTEPVLPFLKWPGGKRELAPTLANLVPSDLGTYFEPFVGSAALFFMLQPTRAVLGDTNAELIDCYLAVRNQPNAVVKALQRLPNSKDDYYRIRKSQPRLRATRAARFIYLVKLAFNGIYRVNRKTGAFNVPYGQHVSRRVVDQPNLLAASRVLQRATVLTRDFAELVETARKGDLVYFDPPYTLRHSNNGFIRYNQNLFSWPDQSRLAHCAAKLANRGVHVIVTNAPHASITRLYPDFQQRLVSRSSEMAADVDARGPVQELILTANLK